MNIITKNAKALILLALIIISALADLLGIGLDLDIEHYIALLLADGIVWSVPNKENNV